MCFPWESSYFGAFSSNRASLLFFKSGRNSSHLDLNCFKDHRRLWELQFLPFQRLQTHLSNSDLAAASKLVFLKAAYLF
jgi:hypothetical protein